MMYCSAHTWGSRTYCGVLLSSTAGAEEHSMHCRSCQKPVAFTIRPALRNRSNGTHPQTVSPALLTLALVAVQHSLRGLIDTTCTCTPKLAESA